MSFAERMQARVADLQAWGQGVYARVPPGVRRNAQRAFSLVFFIPLAALPSAIEEYQFLAMKLFCPHNVIILLCGFLLSVIITL